MSNVYLIRSGKKGPIKIGVADNVAKRMSDLQTGNPNELLIEAIIPCRNKKEAYVTEKWIHKICSKDHVRGEWFSSKLKLSKIQGIMEASHSTLKINKNPKKSHILESMELLERNIKWISVKEIERLEYVLEWTKRPL